MNGPAPVGLYSISVRGLTVPALLSWAAGEDVPLMADHAATTWLAVTLFSGLCHRSCGAVAEGY